RWHAGWAIYRHGHRRRRCGGVAQQAGDINCELNEDPLHFKASVRRRLFSWTRAARASRKRWEIGAIERLTIFHIAILLWRLGIYDAGRKNSLPPRGRRLAPRHESPPHPAGVDEGHSDRDRQDHQPVLPL